MFDWNDLRFFLEMSRLGKLAEAAQRLHVDNTTVSRRIAALETALGTRLFDKSPRGHDLSGEDTELTGTVRLATPEAFGTHFLTPLLPEFRR
eukprot:gene12994-16520_t